MATVPLHEAATLFKRLSWPNGYLHATLMRLAQAPIELLVMSLHTRDGKSRGAFEMLGTSSGVSAGYGSLLRQVIASEAKHVVLLHNHPSGSPFPSAQDISATATLRALCRAFDITLHDHLVIGGSRCTSIVRSGLVSPGDQR